MNKFPEFSDFIEFVSISENEYFKQPSIRVYDFDKLSPDSIQTIIQGIYSDLSAFSMESTLKPLSAYHEFLAQHFEKADTD